MYVRILNDFLFFFFTLFAVSSTCSIAVAQITLGISLLLYLIILVLRKENPFTGKLKLFYSFIGLYIFWMILAALMGETPKASLFILKEEWLFFAIPVGIYILQKESYRKKTILAFAIAVGIISIYGLIQHVTGVYWFKKAPPIEAFDFGYRVKGFFPHRLTFGNYYATASMFLLGYLALGWNTHVKKIKILLIITVILSVLVTLFSYSYGPIFALLGTIVLFGFFLSRKYTFIVIGSLICIGIIIFSINPTLRERISKRVNKELNVQNEASRIYIWDNALKMVEDNPVFGVGQGNFYPQFEKNMPGHRIHVHAHNDFLNIAALAGIPGFLFFTGIWFSLFYLIGKSWRYDRSLLPYMAAGLFGSVAFLITSLTEATFADEEVRQMLMFVWAFGLFPFLARYNKERNQTDSAV